MASPRALIAALAPAGLALSLTACAPAGGTGATVDVGYEKVIAAVVLAESDAGGRAFDVEIEDATAQVHVAAGDRAVEVDVDLAGPTVTDRRDEGEVESEDRSAVSLATAVELLTDANGRAAAFWQPDPDHAPQAYYLRRRLGPEGLAGLAAQIGMQQGLKPGPAPAGPQCTTRRASRAYLVGVRRSVIWVACGKRGWPRNDGECGRVGWVRAGNVLALPNAQTMP